MIEELKDATEEERRRIDALRAVVLAEEKRHDPDRPTPNVSIYCFRDVWGSVRVSEVSVTRGMGGGSWMHGDLDAFPVVYAAERYLAECLFPVEDHGDGAVYDPEQEARRGLIYWLDPKHDYNALPEWEEREANPLTNG